MNKNIKVAKELLKLAKNLIGGIWEESAVHTNRVGGCSLFEQPSSHTTVRAVRHTAVQ